VKINCYRKESTFKSRQIG